MTASSAALTAYQSTRDPEIKQELILKYAPLVKYIAGRLVMFLPSSVEIEDLINDGIIGLIDALEKFDPKKGVNFEVYARFRIRGSMIDAIRSLDWVPRSMRKNAKQLENVREELGKRLGRTPKKEEIAEEMDLTPTQLDHYYHILNDSYIISLDELQQVSDNLESLTFNLASREGADVHEQAERKIRREILMKTLKELSEREQLILSLYYFEGLTIREIKLILGISEARISQLHTRSLHRLREKLTRRFMEI